MLVLGTFIIQILILICRTCAYIFNTQDVISISHVDVTNRYFGYSVLLQKGDDPIVTVGAPKDQFVNNKQYGGEVFQCKIKGNKTCQSAFKSEDELYKSPNGDFLGATLDGEDDSQGLVMACSPRTPIEFNFNSKTFLYGKCVFRKNSAHIMTKFHSVRVIDIRGGIPTVVRARPKKSFYLYGYGLLGFAISVYNKDNILCGVPRRASIGATLLFPSSKFEDPSIQEQSVEVKVIPKLIRDPEIDTYSDQYFGYSVNAAKNLQNNEIWFIAGSPRANNLTGAATLYKYVGNSTPNEMGIIETFLGEEFGSYFGASVLTADLTNDKFLDVIVGAPLVAGKTYDEGCVFFYKSLANTNFLKKKLTGSSKIGSRFGTSIAFLGDVDLDGFNDISISAPYEDDDGVVYIYKGNSDGVEEVFSQRLSPAFFQPALTAKGFGLGLSKGNDINNDGHNDVAIGAYKSDKVFVIQSYGLVELKTFLKPTINAISEITSEFDLELYLNYTKRSILLNVPSLEFNVNVYLDYRAVERVKKSTVKVNLGATAVQKYRIQIKPIEMDIYPFVINTELTVINAKNIKVLGIQTLEKTIPYALGCSGNNTCITGLSIQTKAKKESITSGVDQQVDLEVSVSNDGDPAFQCLLIIEAPVSAQLRNVYDCKYEGKNYTCLFSNKIDKNMTKTAMFVFDLKNLNLQIRELQFNISVVSYGVNKKSYKNAQILKIPVLAQILSYVVGNSVPSSIEVSRVPEATDTEVIHRFTIGKLGPSLLKLNVSFLIPVVEYRGENIFNILQIQGYVNEVALTCKPSLTQISLTQSEILKQLEKKQVPLNNTILIYCDDIHECDQYNCFGQVERLNEIAVFEVRMRIISKLIVLKYKYELRRRNLVAYLPVAVQNNPERIEEKIIEAADLLIFVQYIKYVPLWIFIVAAFIGLALLFVIIIGLYQCRFFNRDYKKLLEEQLTQNEPARATKRCCDEQQVNSPGPSESNCVENEYVEL